MPTPGENPIVRVTPPQLIQWPGRVEEIQADYKKLRKGYAEVDAINFLTLSREEERNCCRTLVAEVFHLADLDPTEHKACFEACIDKCVSTNAIKAQHWSTWGGYRDFTHKLADIARRMTCYKRFHIMSAPSVVAAAAVKKLRNVDTKGNDHTTTMIFDCKVFEFIPASVQVWKPGQKGVVQTDQPYTGRPLVNDVALIGNDSTDADGDEDDDVEFISTSRVTQTRNRVPVMHAAQQFDQPWANPVTPSPEPVEMRNIKRRLTRDEAMTKVGDLIKTATSRNWTEEKNEELRKALTKQIVSVLPQDIKVHLGIFAGMTKNEQIEKWINECQNDKATVEWTETEEIPRKPRWSKNGPLETVLEEWQTLANTADGLSSASRHKIRQTIHQVRYIYREQEENADRDAKAKAMKAVDELSRVDRRF